jgi:uncharacterized oligopeptide transporter (OPT) family protein
MPRPEGSSALTLRGVALGAMLRLLFTAANACLGLKVGLTFATSIPAAVISMAVPRRFAGSTLRENNIVQTIASAAENLSFARIGIGHLAGPSVGAAMALGLAIGWAGLVPLLTAEQPMPGADRDSWVGAVFRPEVRVFGAGVMGVAAVWTRIRIIGPVLGGIRSAFATRRARREGRTVALEERDLPIAAVILVTLGLLAPIA